MGILGITRRQLVGIAGLLSARAAVDAATPPPAGSGASARVGSARYPQTAIEASAGVAPANLSDPSGPLRYGAVGDGAANDQPAWSALGRVGDHHFVPWLTYLVASKVQLVSSVTLVGASRSSTIQAASFPDYVLEVGENPAGPNPQAGTIERLKLVGAKGNKGLLHLQALSHMWHIEDLLLYSSPCPAFVVDGCWDSNYDNIDIIGCGGTSGNPAADCAVIVRNGCNNLFFRSLRIEQAAYGSLFVGDAGGSASGGAGPVYLLHGKIDLGYIKQHAPAVTVTSNGALVCSNWAITGLNLQPAFAVQGGLTLRAGVTVAGGSGVPAVQDRRAWSHVDTTTFGPGAAQTSAGPYLPRIDLGDTQFSSATIYINQITPAVIQSKIFPVRVLDRIGIIANGGPGRNSFSVFTDFRAAANHVYTGCYLVNNRIGTLARGRRRIAASFTTGQLTLVGAVGVELGSDYSIEYCGGHHTPIQAEAVQMGSGMDLFAVLQAGATIIGTPSYAPASAVPGGGCTSFELKAPRFSRGADATGYYLLDEQTGEPFLIGHGFDARGRIGVLYDRTGDIDTTHSFAIVAGYLSGVTQRGGFYEWLFAGERHGVSIRTAEDLGFDRDNMPLWAFGAAGRPIALPSSASIVMDLSMGSEFVITALEAGPFKVGAPVNGRCGSRVLVMIRNASGGALGSIGWDPAYKMAAWINPAATSSRSIEFMSDGSHWIEIGRTPADVPN